MKKRPKISAAEWEVLKAVWDDPVSPAQEIADKVAAKNDWSPRTVKTLLSRLVKKGALRYKTDGKRYLYEPQIKRDELVRQESQSFLDRVFDGVTLPMLAHFVKSGHLTRDEIEALKKMLDEKDAS